MNPIDKYAALRALEHGISGAVAVAAEEVEQLRKLTRAKSFESDWGSISVTTPKPTISYDPAALLEWAQAHMPHEVIPEHTEVVPAAVRPTLAKTLEVRFQLVDGEVIDTETGEAIPFAKVTQRPEYLAMRMPADKKAEAVAYVAGHVAEVAGVMQLEVTQ